MLSFRSRLLAGLSAVTLGVTVMAQAPKADIPADTKAPGDLTKSEEANAKLFKELTRKLLELAVKLDKSDRSEDKDRAKTIRAALDVAEKAGIENQFRTLLGGMGAGNKLQDVEKLIGQDEELSKTLLEMLNILMTDDETARLKAEIVRLEKFLKEAEELKRRQELLRTMTDTKKGEPGKIGEKQNDLAQQTKDLAGRMGSKGESPKGPQAESKSDPKAADPKDGEKASDPKADAEGPKSEGKEGDPKKGSDDKPAKGGEPKESKAGEPKDGEAKPGEPKAGSEAKPEEKSDSKDAGQGKGQAKPSEGKPGDGKGKPSPPAGASPPPPPGSSKSGGSPPSGSPPAAPPPPQQAQAPGRKNVEEAYPHQKGAEDDAKKDKRDDASKKMDKAVEELARAIEEMKKRLKQLREEEMLKLLANLEARCNRMLAMQIEVYQNTKAIHDGVVKNGNSKTNADIQKSQQQADKEKEIVAEAEKTLKLLETEGSAVAFARVLEEVMGDMQAVQLRLEKAVVESDTQVIEENIIAMLKDMVAALKKQQQEMQNSKNNPPPPGQPNKPNQKLIDQLAELKLIRAMQQQVNTRTTMYGKKSDGEQAVEALLQNEIKQLAQRQAKIQDMIQKIATQANQ